MINLQAYQLIAAKILYQFTEWKGGEDCEDF